MRIQSPQDTEVRGVPVKDHKAFTSTTRNHNELVIKVWVSMQMRTYRMTAGKHESYVHHLVRKSMNIYSVMPGDSTVYNVHLHNVPIRRNSHKPWETKTKRRKTGHGRVCIQERIPLVRAAPRMLETGYK